MKTTLLAEQQISQAKVRLMNAPEWRWMAGILMMGETKFVSGKAARIPTAATDGLNETYNRDWLSKLDVEEVMFVVLHEGFHKMFRHLFVWRNLWDDNPRLANIACDVVINTQYLHGKPGIKFVKGGVHMEEYADAMKWNAKSIFDDLKKKGTGQGAGHDSHDWEAARDLTPAEAKELEKQIDAAIRQASLAGDMLNGMPRGIKEMLVPEVDWKSLLAEFVKTQCTGDDKHTWRRPHKTYLAHDLYLPTPYSDTVGKIMVAIDTSGSIGDEALSYFLGHCQHLVNEVNPDGVNIVWWGGGVVGVDSFERGNLNNLASAVKPIGGGGTDPSCIPAWIKKEKREYVAAVVLTDGEFDCNAVGHWDIPVLWLVVNNGDTGSIPVGVTVKVKELNG